MSELDQIRTGDIKRGDELGKTNTNRYTWYIWSACGDCGKERWVGKRKGKPRSKLCLTCWATRKQKSLVRHGEQHSRWKGGRCKNSVGYIRVWANPNNFFYPMVNSDGYIMEHRLVMAKHLGRNLHSWELVHHKNHIKDDNRIENLQLVSEDRHRQITILERKIKKQAESIKELKLEVERLKIG